MAFRSNKLNIKLLIAFILVFLLFVYIRQSTLYLNTSWTWPIRSGVVHNILDSRYEPKKDSKSIFFIETSKVIDNVVRLNPRQSCSIESAGKFINATSK